MPNIPSNRAATIYESTIKSINPDNPTPGPADYSPKMTSKNNSVLWIVGDGEFYRKANNKLSALIGPGTYKPNYDSIKPNSRNPNMSKSTRPPLLS